MKLPPSSAIHGRTRFRNVTYVDARHRHMHEANPDMVPEFENAGLLFVGKDDTERRMEFYRGWICWISSAEDGCVKSHLTVVANFEYIDEAKALAEKEEVEML